MIINNCINKMLNIVCLNFIKKNNKMITISSNKQLVYELKNNILKEKYLKEVYLPQIYIERLDDDINLYTKKYITKYLVENDKNYSDDHNFFNYDIELLYFFRKVCSDYFKMKKDNIYSTNFDIIELKVNFLLSCYKMDKKIKDKNNLNEDHSWLKNELNLLLNNHNVIYSSKNKSTQIYNNRLEIFLVKNKKLFTWPLIYDSNKIVFLKLSDYIKIYHLKD